MSTFTRHDIARNAMMLRGPLRKRGYDWWWHSFTGRSERTGEERAFFVEFFLCNPALVLDDPGKPILGQNPRNKALGKKPSYLMVKAGWWGKGARQLHRFFSWDDVQVQADAPYQLSADDCLATEIALRGSVTVTSEQAAEPGYMCNEGAMSWDLQVDKLIAFNVGYGAGGLSRTLNAMEMYWHAEGMKTAFAGTVTANGERYVVDPATSFGYADKNWGSNFTSPWIWLSSNCLTSTRTGKRLQNSVFDIGGGRPRAFGIGLDRILLGAFYYEGTPIEFNFSKFWTRAKTTFDCCEEAERIVWNIEQQNRQYVMKTQVTCQKDHMLLVNYEAPDGSKLHNRLWNGGDGTGRIQLYQKRGARSGDCELIDDIEATHIGCEYGVFDGDERGCSSR